MTISSPIESIKKPTRFEDTLSIALVGFVMAGTRCSYHAEHQGF